MTKDTLHRGITWRDFPGNCDQTNKKFNFALFRRGTHVFNGLSAGLEGEALKARLQELSAKQRSQFGRIKRRKDTAA